MYLLSNPICYNLITCKIKLIGNYSSTFRIGSRPVIIIRSTRKAAKIESIENTTGILRCGDETIVKFKLENDYLFGIINDVILMTESGIRAVGSITNLEIIN